MRRSGFVTLAICSVLTLASATGWSAPTDAHDIYMALKNRFGQSCCNEGDCRPAHYRTTANGVQMLVDGEWLAVPDEAIQYRALEGDTGETRGGHTSKSRHQKTSETAGRNGASIAKFRTRRPAHICETSRYREVSQI